MEKIKNNLIITSLVAIAILASIWIFISNNAVIDNSLPENKTSQQNNDFNNQASTPQEGVVTLLINFGEQGTFDFQTKHQKGQTALSLLIEAAQERGVMVETTEYDFGIMVDSINDMESSAEIAWIYYVNGESANIGAAAYETKPGDVIEWKYIEPIQ